MSKGVAARKRTKTEDTSRVFFAVILAIDIVMFCAIAGLEFRAFRLAALTEADPALEIEIERPEAVEQEALWRTASMTARMLYSDGKEAYRKCALCHSIDDPAPNYGPHLGCIARSAIADIEKNSNAGYRFSAALRSVGRRRGGRRRGLFGRPQKGRRRG